MPHRQGVPARSDSVERTPGKPIAIKQRIGPDYP